MNRQELFRREAEMKFTKNELVMVGRHAAGNRDETLERISRAMSETGDALDRAFLYNAAEKLKRTAEPECSSFLAGVRQASAERSGTVRQRLALIRAEKNVVLGHDLCEVERFRKETRHMITLDVLEDGSPVGSRGDHYRAFLSDERYQNAKRSEDRGEIKIRSHAAVKNGSIVPDRKQREPER